MEAERARPIPWPSPRVSFAHQLFLISIHTRPHNKEKLGFKAFQAKWRVETVMTIKKLQFGNNE